jgi:hypothetical protein
LVRVQTTSSRPVRRAAVALLAIAVIGVVAVVLLTGCSRGNPSNGSTGSASNQPTVCLYTRNGISGLEQAATRLGVAPPRCAVVFDRAAPDWQAWERPWFLGNRITNDAWDQWARQPGRRLVITLGLIPASAIHENWRRLGASGAYAAHAQVLAQNLVASGLGSAIIRLSNEPNGTWFPDRLGQTATDRALWVKFWQKTAATMLGVPGTHFKFDWTVANGTGDVPLSAYYPGDQLVSYIGDDIYDAGFQAPPSERWSHLATMTGGVDAVTAFAEAHHKPFSIPEWGLAPPPAGGGDDPEFVRAIAQLTHRSDFAYQGYFYAGQSQILANSPASMAAYREGFHGAR